MSSAGQDQPRRSLAIDALRGAAIVSMLAANLAGPCLRPPHPSWLRVFGSFAAPAFVLLAGMMVSRSMRPRSWPRLLKRSVVLLVLAAGIDVVCWGIQPFETFDVLYLLAFAMPVVAGCLRLPAWLHWALALALVLLTPWLQAALGYGPLLPDEMAYPWPVWRRALVDGWFPLFPWLGVALLGGAVGRAGWSETTAGPLLFAAGLVLSLLGGLGWWLSPPVLTTRGGYSELFYPPSLPYLALALGSVLLLLAAFRSLGQRLALIWLATLGQASLELYVLHVALIALALDTWFERATLPVFIGLYSALLLAVSSVAWLLKRYRSKIAPRGSLDGRDRAARTAG